MIETYKILLGIYDSAVSPVLPVCQHSVTRGNNYKLVKNFSRYDIIRQHVYTRLPSHVVNSSLVNIFRNNLDTFWSNQEVVTKRSIITLNVRSSEPEMEICQNWLESCCTEALHKDEGLEASQPASSTSIRYDTTRYDSFRSVEINTGL